MLLTKLNQKIKLALEVSWVFHLSFINNEKLYEKFPSDLKKNSDFISGTGGECSKKIYGG